MKAAFRAALTISVLAISLGDAAACANNHIQANLDVFPAEAVSRPLYWAAEGDGQTTFTIRVFGTTCDGTTVRVGYAGQDGTAATAADYSLVPGNVVIVNGPGHSDRASREVQITNDVVPELPSAVEMAEVVLNDADNARLVPPTNAALVIVDDDGPTPRFSLAEGAYEEMEGTANGGVPVFRGGNASAASTVDYAVSPGNAAAGQDYEAVAAGTLTFAPDDRAEVIPITVLDDAERESTETLTVSISGPGVEAPSSVTFAIADNEERLAPSSTLHHPNQGRRYPASHFLIREIHIFTKDDGGSGVTAAEFALRKNLKNRSCEWWSGRKFRKGKCDGQRWLKTGQYETDFFFIRLKELRPSVGSIRNYTAFSRAIDGAKNVETRLDSGRNANTFEIRKTD